MDTCRRGDIGNYGGKGRIKQENALKNTVKIICNKLRSMYQK